MLSAHANSTSLACKTRHQCSPPVAIKRSQCCRLPQTAVVRRQARCIRLLCASAADSKGPQQLKLFCPQHPLVGHWLTVARNKLSPPVIFRGAVAELGRCLIYEASQGWLPTLAAQVETPLGVADCQYVNQDEPIHVIPILRAGLVLLESAATVLPSVVTYHVGYVRDEKTLEASMYLNKLPDKFSPDDKIMICDTMVATGGTLVQLLQELEGRGASQENIRVITVVIAAQACNYLAKNKFDRIRVYCAMIDEKLDEQGFIVPGLGDAGDRSFNTK